MTLDPLATKTTSRVKLSRLPTRARARFSMYARFAAGIAPGAKSGSTAGVS